MVSKHFLICNSKRNQSFVTYVLFKKIHAIPRMENYQLLLDINLKKTEIYYSIQI